MNPKLLLLIAFPFLLAFKSDKPAYIIYTSEGKTITYDKMVNELLKYDVVFFGELHNDPIAHWLQIEMTESDRKSVV